MTAWGRSITRSLAASATRIRSPARSARSRSCAPDTTTRTATSLTHPAARSSTTAPSIRAHRSVCHRSTPQASSAMARRLRRKNRCAPSALRSTCLAMASSRRCRTARWFQSPTPNPPSAMDRCMDRRSRCRSQRTVCRPRRPRLAPGAFVQRCRPRFASSASAVSAGRIRYPAY